MKTFGADRLLQEKYKHHHIHDECDGVWRLTEEAELPYRLEEGIMIVIKSAPMVKCDKCQAMYFQEGFEEAFLRHLAGRMALSTKPLHKHEIRFLRTYIGFTQEQMAKALSVSKTDISKYESTKIKEDRNMEDHLLIHFKLLVASELGLTIKPEHKLWKIEHLGPPKSHVINAKDIQQLVG